MFTTRCASFVVANIEEKRKVAIPNYNKSIGDFLKPHK